MTPENEAFQSTLPYAGSDSIRSNQWHYYRNFNPRSPTRGATQLRDTLSIWIVISIHAPLRGERQFPSSRNREMPSISIHAPLRGERQVVDRPAVLFIHFNPRSPTRGATGKEVIFVENDCLFQSTLPYAGSDDYPNAESITELEFQSTLPYAGSDQRPFFRYGVVSRISIHAPLRGERRHTEKVNFMVD